METFALLNHVLTVFAAKCKDLSELLLLSIIFYQLYLAGRGGGRLTTSLLQYLMQRLCQRNHGVFCLLHRIRLCSHLYQHGLRPQIQIIPVAF